MKLVAQYWNGFGWVVVDNDADLDDGEGGIDYFNRLFAHGFADESDARIWVTLFELQRAAGAAMKRHSSDWRISL